MICEHFGSFSRPIAQALACRTCSTEVTKPQGFAISRFHALRPAKSAFLRTLHPPHKDRRLNIIFYFSRIVKLFFAENP